MRSSGSEIVDYQWIELFNVLKSGLNADLLYSFVESAVFLCRFMHVRLLCHQGKNQAGRAFGSCGHMFFKQLVKLKRIHITVFQRNCWPFIALLSN